MKNIVSRMVGLGVSLAAPLLVLGALLLAQPPSARASNVVVNVCTAAGLANKLAIAVDGDVVTFACPGGQATIVVTHTQVIQHNITINGGGVITLSGGSAVGILAVPAGHSVTLSYLTFAHGKAAQGGALLVTGTVAADNDAFVNNQTLNSVTSGGAAAYVTTGGQLVVKDSRFVTNTAQPLGQGGGAIFNSGILTTVNVLFFGNVAESGGAIQQQAGRAFVASSNFISNAAIFGGAVMANSNLVLFADTFDHNHAQGTPIQISGPQGFPLPVGGGGLYVTQNSNVVIVQTRFFSNTAFNDTLVGLGGAVVNFGSLDVADSRIDENAAQSDGGAIYNAGTAAFGSSDLTDNYSFKSGGAISNTGTLTVATSVLGHNGAAANGGALDNWGHASLLVDLIAENVADAGGAARNEVGGVLSVGASRLASNAAVSNAGGGLLNNATLTVTNSTLDSNYSAQNGAALSNGGSSSATALVLNSTVISNTSVASAAGLRRFGGTLTLINTIVSGNQPNNCSGTVVDGGHNLQFSDATCGLSTQANPRLGPEQNNGGPSVGTAYGAIPTFALLPNSPAINTGDDGNCPARDERGFLRVAPCDIGAIERAFPQFLPLIEK